MRRSVAPLAAAVPATVLAMALVPLWLGPITEGRESPFDAGAFATTAPGETCGPFGWFTSPAEADDGIGRLRVGDRELVLPPDTRIGSATMGILGVIRSEEPIHARDTSTSVSPSRPTLRVRLDSR